MPVHSKWQSLPTEAINPDTLALDKLSPADIVEHMLHEDRKMLAAVQREKDRIAVGIEIRQRNRSIINQLVIAPVGTHCSLWRLVALEQP